MIENKGFSLFKNPSTKLYDYIEELGKRMNKVRDRNSEPAKPELDQDEPEEPTVEPNPENKEKQIRTKKKFLKRVKKSFTIGLATLTFMLGIVGDTENSKVTDTGTNQDLAANLVPNVSSEITQDNNPVISVDATSNVVEKEVVDSTIEGLLEDFSSRYNFDLMETDEESLNHVDQLANDEYATNFLLSRMTSDLEGWQQIQDNGELEVNLAEVVTDMYYRRDSLGNPILGVYFNPDIVSQAIKNSDSKVVNLSFPIGWMEYNVTLSELRFPELYQYQINGEEVFSENPNLNIKIDEEGREELIEDVYENINISEMNESERADFLKQNVDYWSEEEYLFLLNEGYITEEEGVLDDYDSTYANKSDDFLFKIDRDGMPRRNQSGDTFSVEKKIKAKVFSAEEAEKIRTEGLVVGFDSPKNRQTGPYQKDAEFPVTEGGSSAEQNQELINQIAVENPDVSIIVSAGEEGSSWDLDERPNNIIIVGLYVSGLSSEGATVYIEPNEETGIVSSDLASAHLAQIINDEEITDIGAYIEENSEPHYVWRNGPNGFSEEEKILVLDI